MDNIFKNIDEYNPNKKRKILIQLDDMITDMLGNKKLQPTVTQFFITSRKINICFHLATLVCSTKKY